MRKVGAFSCLAKGLKALRPNLLASCVFAWILSAISGVPTLINRLQGHEYMSPQISPWGFLTSLIFWIMQTLILVGVSQVVWVHLKNDSQEHVPLLPNENVRPQIFLWAVSFTVVTFVPLLGPWLVEQMASKPLHFTPLPTLPIVFYFVAFIPLMMVEQQCSMWKALKQVLSSIKVNFVFLVKLALTAEVIFLVFGSLGIISGELIRDTFSIAESVVVEQVIWDFAVAPGWAINSAMMAVAYAELQGLSVVGHQESGNPVYEER
jgi:hypothetical protein